MQHNAGKITHQQFQLTRYSGVYWNHEIASSWKLQTASAGNTLVCSK